MSSDPVPPRDLAAEGRRSEPVYAGADLIGHTARLNIAEVEAILHEPGRPWDRAIGLYRRRPKGAAALRAIADAAEGA